MPLATLVLVLVTGLVAVFQSSVVAAEATGSAGEPAFVIRGKVQRPDGQPLAGAKIHLATVGGMARLYYLTNSTPANARVSKTWTTSAVDGTFMLSLPELPRENKAVVVVHDDAGYALATATELSENPELRIQPWGRIEGVLKLGKDVGSNQTVNIGIWGTSETYEWNLVSHGFSVKTDENGRFVFPRVAPGDVWLTRTVAIRPGEGRQSGHHYVKVRPGETVRVTLGGSGCTLTGHLENIPKSPSNLVFHGSMWAREFHRMRQPRNWRSLTAEEKRRYVRDWRDSPESLPFKEEVRNYEFPVRPDGTFQVEDVLPGSYRMQVQAEIKPARNESPRPPIKVELQIEVPEVREMGSLLDIGGLELPTEP